MTLIHNGSHVLTSDYNEHNYDDHHYADDQRGVHARLGSEQAPRLGQAAVVGQRGDRQQAAHQRVNVHAVQAADFISLPEAGPRRCQERVHAG